MEEGQLEKIIKPIIGLALVCYLTYIGLGLLFKGGETVIDRMEERAAKAKDCERAKLNYQKSPSEKLKATVDAVCNDI